MNLRHYRFHRIASGLVTRPLLRFLCRAQAHYEGPIPRGAVVLAANHRSFLDPILVGSFWRRHVAYFAKASLWQVPIISQVLDQVGGFAIDRNEPQLAIMKRVVAALRSGTSICLFPEGTRSRSGRMGRLRAGVALFARRASVPVVPVYLIGTDRAWPRGWPLPRPSGGVHIIYGRPLLPPPELSGRAAEDWVTTRLQAWFDRHEATQLAHCPLRALESRQ